MNQVAGDFDPSDPYGYRPPGPGQPPSNYPPSYGQPADPNAPYGYDHFGRPLSDKSKVVAGLLQLLPALFFALGGIGRLYAGNTSLGVAQLVATAIGWASFVCGFFLVLPFLFTAAVWLWFVIDGIVLLVGDTRDQYGRLLRA